MLRRMGKDLLIGEAGAPICAPGSSPQRAQSTGAQVVFSVHLAPRDDMTANDIEAAVDVLEAYPGAPRRHEPYSSRGSTRSIRSSCLSVSPGGPARELESVQPVASINNSPLWNLVPATLGASMAPRNRGRRRKLAPAGGAAAYA